MMTPLNCRFNVLARLAAASVMTTGLVAGAVAAPAAAQPREALEYVALGDSYSAGVGAGGAVGECGQSSLGYPELLDRNHSIDLVANASCSGATTDDVVPGAGVAPQIAELSEETDLVTITIGGNDVGFAAVAFACSTDPGSAACASQIEAALSAAVTVLPGKLDKTFTAIGEAAPNAHVVVMGYPQLFSPQFVPSGPAAAGADALNDGVDLLNALIAQEALAAGFQYIDVTKEFRNHGVGAPQPWIHGANGGLTFHPTDDGYKKGYLKAFKTGVQVNKLQKAASGS